MSRAPLLAVTGGVLALLAAAVMSLLVGARAVDPTAAWQALVAFDPAVTDHVVVQARLDRTLSGIAVGASLALAGTALYYLGSTFGWSNMAVWYFIPYLWVNHWLG